MTEVERYITLRQEGQRIGNILQPQDVREWLGLGSTWWLDGKEPTVIGQGAEAEEMGYIVGRRVDALIRESVYNNVEEDERMLHAIVVEVAASLALVNRATSSRRHAYGDCSCPACRPAYSLWQMRSDPNLYVAAVDGQEGRSLEGMMVTLTDRATCMDTVLVALPSLPLAVHTWATVNVRPSQLRRITDISQPMTAVLAWQNSASMAPTRRRVMSDDKPHHLEWVLEGSDSLTVRTGRGPLVVQPVGALASIAVDREEMMKQVFGDEVAIRHGRRHH